MMVSKIGVSAAVALVIAVTLAWAQSDAPSNRGAGAGQERGGRHSYGAVPSHRGSAGSDRENASDTSYPARTQSRSLRSALRHSPQFSRASELIGKDIVDVQGKSVGDVDDLAIDTRHGLVAYAIVARDRVLGADERLVAVPFRALSQAAGRERVTLQTDAALLDYVPAAPESDARMADIEWANQLYSQFNLRPYWESTGRASASAGQRPHRSNLDEDLYGYEGSEWDERGARQGARPSEFPDDVYGWEEGEYSEEPWPRERGQRGDRQDRRAIQDPEARSGQQRGTAGRGYQRDWYDEDRDRGSRGGYGRSEMEAQTWMSGRNDPDRRPMRRAEDIETSGRQARAGAGEPGAIVRAGDLIGEDIEGLGGDSIGEIDDLMIDLRTGGIGYAVVSEGGLLAGDERYAVPWTVFEFSRAEGQTILSLHMTEDDLADAPAFDDDNWPDMSSPQWIASIHEYYQVQPSWTYYGYVETASSGRSPVSFDPSSMRRIEGTIDGMSRRGRLAGEEVVQLRIRASEGSEQGVSGEGATTRPSGTPGPGTTTQPAQARHRDAGGRGRTVLVYLSPVYHLRAEGLSLRPGERVIIEGSQVTVRGGPAVLATSLAKEGRTLRIRDEQGRPLWTQSAGSGEGVPQSVDPPGDDPQHPDAGTDDAAR